MTGITAISDDVPPYPTGYADAMTALRSLVALQARLADSTTDGEIADATLKFVRETLGADGAVILPADDSDTLGSGPLADAAGTMVTIPLAVHGQHLGLLVVRWIDSGALLEAHRLLLEVAGGQIATALDRLVAARHHDDASRARLAEQAAREQLDTILGGVADGVIVQREDGRFIYANDVAARMAAARMAGFESAEAYLGASTFEISQRLSVLDAEGQPFPSEQLPARRAFRGEPAPEMIVQFRRASTDEIRWSRTQSRIVPGPDGQPLAISIFHDITDEVRAQDRLRFLAEAGARLAGTLDVDEALETLVHVASTTLADWAVVILVDEEGTVQVQRTG